MFGVCVYSFWLVYVFYLCVVVAYGLLLVVGVVYECVVGSYWFYWLCVFL